MVFEDMKKAFNTHQILCKKLESYGILHRERTWLESYLSNGVQYRRVNGVNLQITISTLECLKVHALVHSFFLFTLMIYQEQ